EKGGRLIMKQEIRLLLQGYVDAVVKLYGCHLKAILLYGSYARGDFHENSDIDIMILVDLSEEQIREKSHPLSDLTFDYNFDHDLMIMPIVKNKTHFEQWLR